MKKLAAKFLVGCVTATMAIVGVGVAPAFASGSTIDIGYTIIDGGYIKGSGSDYNTGDYTNVCVVIMVTNSSELGVHNVTQSCRSNRGHNWWSAPDYRWSYPAWGTCDTYYTRITAYRNGTRVANKNSNDVAICS